MIERTFAPEDPRLDTRRLAEAHPEHRHPRPKGAVP
jgi:hypothetical protein